jgi:UDP-N-acetylglucosamine diphosphorylase / glucose-1-phosphate thymidylyltransferase / UDP-N-acetylgalactosamine diphosphorylase / glucosamine-1-phosphate N-acetyltransferase / galactosamine-1-phosphate N-acetyltransferase
MAGHGRRFADAGFDVPKPLIEVGGRPMYSWATDSIPSSLVDRLVFVALDEHLDGFGLREDIARRYGTRDVEVVGLAEVTQGQACTVLAAREVLDPDAPLIIYNADTACRTDLERTLRAPGPGPDGVIGVFEADGDHWSFARTDESGRVLETAEKRRISPWATTGLYHFARAGAFLDAADAMVRAGARVGGEYYVAPLYNELIARGARIVVDRARAVWPLGTPEELARFDPGQVR